MSAVLRKKSLDCWEEVLYKSDNPTRNIPPLKIESLPTDDIK